MTKEEVYRQLEELSKLLQNKGGYRIQIKWKKKPQIEKIQFLK